jgi:hypothetical protein
LEVGERHGDESCDDDEDYENDEQYGVDGVHLVAPYAGKYVVELDVNGREGQKACKSTREAIKQDLASPSC